MYFQRTKQLDCPQWMRDEILEEIELDNLVKTGLSQRENLPPIETAIAKYADKPHVVEYIKKIYGTNDITGWQVSNELTQKIYNYYDSFLSLVPDEPKLIIKRIMSDKESFWTHNGFDQLSSLTCVIKTDHLATTNWYTAKPEFKHIYDPPPGSKFENKLGSNLFPTHSQFVTSICMQPWEMIFFDHNAYHSVENFVPGMERILFSIGYLNTTEDELEDAYIKWCNQHHA